MPTAVTSEPTAKILPQVATSTLVELPDATYPALALSGDDLNRFLIDTRRAMALLYSGDGEACAYLLDDVVDRLAMLRADYEHTLRVAGRLTPYVPGHNVF